MKSHKLLEIAWLVLGFLRSWFRSQGEENKEADLVFQVKSIH